MILVVVILHVLVSLFLIAVILLQAGRGQGLSWGVFGGTPQSILGTRTASFLSRVTTACAIIFLFTCIILNIVETRKQRSLLAPVKLGSQVDFQKIKDALDQAAKTTATQKAASGQPAGQTAETQAASTQATPASKEPPQNQTVTPVTPAPEPSAEPSAAKTDSASQAPSSSN